MKTNLKSLLLVGALMMPLAGFAADGDSVGTKVGDSVVTTKVKAAFAKDKVSSTTKSKAEAEQAVKLAKATKGVTSVKNDIVVAD